MVAPAVSAAPEDEYEIEIEQEEGAALVTVTQNDSAAANTSVSVSLADSNATYNGTGDYTTNDAGEIRLPAPSEEVSVVVSVGNASETADLEPASAVAEDEAEDEAENESENESQVDTPFDGDEEKRGASATAKLFSFGKNVSSFVAEVQADENMTERERGLAIANYVTENNPGNSKAGDQRRGPPESAGPPEDAGPDRNATDEDDQRRGPPEDAGPDREGGNSSDDAENERGGPDRGADAEQEEDGSVTETPTETPTTETAAE